MRIGLSVTSSYPGSDGRGAATAMLARARSAASAGLDHLSVGDRHATGPNMYIQNVPIVGAMMANWPTEGGEARPVGLLLLLPFWHPVLAAEQIATLASMTDARFIVQTGIGSGDEMFAAMGVSPRRRGAVTDESIKVIKGLLAGERVTSDMLGVSKAQIAPVPIQPVEWWIGSGLTERPLERAAREGDAWNVSPNHTAAELAPAIDHYRQRCSYYGTKPRVCLRRDIYVAADDDLALKTGRELVSQGYRGMTEEVLVFGGQERVAERLAPFAALGVDDIVARTMAVEDSAALASIELLGAVRRMLG